MSIGHHGRFGGIRTAAELKEMLATSDTAKMAKRRVGTDFTKDVPLGFGISVDAHAVFGDRRYVAEIKSGRIRVSGMEPQQVIAAHIDHEVIEKAVADGDNPVDIYEGAHPFGERAEHEEVKRVRGSDHGYEEALGSGLARCYRRDPANPPRELWCGPLLDEPSKRDKDLLRMLRVKGVEDAGKSSKRSAGYGFGAEQCKSCRHFGGGVLATCALVAGLVRADRQCDWWSAKK